MSFNAIREKNILAKISGLTVSRYFLSWVDPQKFGQWEGADNVIFQSSTYFTEGATKIVGEYDQEIQQTHTADKPMAS